MADRSRLNNYAQKRNIPFPTYSCEMQGPPHSRLFKASVTIDGKTYVGPEFCSTLKDAENTAAKVAFLSLSPNGPEEDDRLYKSLLQELAQSKGLPFPFYTTNGSGQPHIPSFSSTVQIAGECYVGKEARTKKQAELNAAEVAYNALIEGKKIDSVTAGGKITAYVPELQKLTNDQVGKEVVKLQKRSGTKSKDEAESEDEKTKGGKTITQNKAKKVPSKRNYEDAKEVQTVRRLKRRARGC